MSTRAKSEASLDSKPSVAKHEITASRTRSGFVGGFPPRSGKERSDVKTSPMSEANSYPLFSFLNFFCFIVEVL